ncbi:AMP-binding protein [Pacificibacter marinus]|uniref:AMP-binding protein n=1 Tax=Pacificibacter marinus TaxID=658057 RepID=UPI001C067BCB|nr:AMP-binding protein [Pacificibacter marinus]MBU2866498.1 AMP-binding protein [Pacificibacter marinus]
MPQSQPHFSWSPFCRIRLPARMGKQNQTHREAVVTLRDCIQTGQSIRMTKEQPSAIQTVTPQLFCETGGSTGAPKVIKRSHASWITSFDINQNLFGITQQDCTAVFGDIGYSLALYGVIEAAHIGADICMLAGLRPDTQCKELQHQHATLLYITPTQLAMLCATNTICPSVRHIIIGGGALPDNLRGPARMSFPNAVLTQFYGASETSFITMANTQTPNGSVGAPYPNVTLRFTDPLGNETQNTGEVWVKSPYLFNGYDQGDSMDTKIQDGFVTIGEFGRLDKAGHLFLLGRKSRMVTVADQNVFPEEIESFVASQFAPEHVVVLAQADALRGHRLTLIVQGAMASQDIILKACRDAFGPLKAPRRLLEIDHLPLLTSGKPDLITLAKWLETQA